MVNVGRVRAEYDDSQSLQASDILDFYFASDRRFGSLAAYYTDCNPHTRFDRQKTMKNPLSAEALRQLFLDARTYNRWQDRPVSDEILHQIHELTRMGPTSANCCPARFIFVKSAEAKARLLECVDKGNREKTETAPVTVIVAYDMEFYTKLDQLFPHTNARSWFEGKDEKILDTAYRNGTLQGAYLMMAARALGLDCGPMTGFKPQKVDEAFLSGTTFRSNFLVNLGYGSEEGLFERSPRFAFDEACQLL